MNPNKVSFVEDRLRSLSASVSLHCVPYGHATFVYLLIHHLVRVPDVYDQGEYH